MTATPVRDEPTLPALTALQADMAAFYQHVDGLIATQPGMCINRGLCCQFGRAGHRLYVSTPEALYFLSYQQQAHHVLRPTAEHDRCPYQRDGQCTARPARPLGCRLYFCDSASATWQGELYEQLHAQAKAIGEKHGLDYRYQDWMAWLTE